MLVTGRHPYSYWVKIFFIHTVWCMMILIPALKEKGEPFHPTSIILVLDHTFVKPMLATGLHPDGHVKICFKIPK